jgi:hypothetical protein
MGRLMGLCNLNMEDFVTLFYTPVVSGARDMPAGVDALFRTSPNPPQPQRGDVPGKMIPEQSMLRCPNASQIGNATECHPKHGLTSAREVLSVIITKKL